LRLLENSVDGMANADKKNHSCLDVRNKKVTKGVKFQNNIDLGDPIEMAVAYSDGGCDELVFYDITLLPRAGQSI
jgi:imidazole glycerol phosphate synthase subunit HisF